MVLMKNGDHRAFSEIYDRYAPKMKAFFYRMLWSDQAMAEDYVHDLFSRIIERPNLYQDGQPLAPWLFQIASNMCKNAYRKRSFEMEYLNQLEKNRIQLPGVYRAIDEKMMLDQVYLVLEMMDEDKRELFLLRYQQQLSIKELKEVFEVSEGTIKSRLHYIRKTLLDTLERNENLKEDERE